MLSIHGMQMENVGLSPGVDPHVKPNHYYTASGLESSPRLEKLGYCDLTLKSFIYIYKT